MSKTDLNVLYYLIVAIVIASCGRKNGKQNLYPRLNNYYMVEYLDNRIILSQMTKTGTLKRVNNDMYMSDGSLLFSTIRDTTFRYYVNGDRIEREIIKTDEGYKTTSNTYAGQGCHGMSPDIPAPFSLQNIIYIIGDI